MGNLGEALVWIGQVVKVPHKSLCSQAGSPSWYFLVVGFGKE